MLYLIGSLEELIPYGDLMSIYLEETVIPTDFTKFADVLKPVIDSHFETEGIRSYFIIYN